MEVYRVSLLVICAAMAIIGVTGQHLGRPDISDDTKAREIFQSAENNASADGYLSEADMSFIFSRFDVNGNGGVDEVEFVAHWTNLNLGDLESAVTMFHRADTNRDGSISKDPDFSRLFYYFDRNGDGQISEDEFVQVWFSLSS